MLAREVDSELAECQLVPVASALPLALSSGAARISWGICAVLECGEVWTRRDGKGARDGHEILPFSAVAARSDKRGSGGGPQERY